MFKQNSFICSDSSHTESGILSPQSHREEKLSLLGQERNVLLSALDGVSN